jgi:hypothetical protein
VGRYIVAGVAAAWFGVLVWPATVLGSGGRVFELVTPAAKNGASAFPVRLPSNEPNYTRNNGFPLIAAADGERFLFASIAGFDGAEFGTHNAYVAQRTSSGWHSTPLRPGSEVRHPTTFGGGGTPVAFDASADFSHVIFGTAYGNYYPMSVSDEYALSSVPLGGGEASNVSGATQGEPVEFGGVAADGSRVVFGTPARLVTNAAEATNVYEWIEGVARPRVIDILPGESEATKDGARVGGPAGYPLTSSVGPFPVGEALGAVSSDGERVAFTSYLPGVGPRELFLRTGAGLPEAEGHTVAVSAPAETGGRAARFGAQFAWMTPDGAHVFFRDDGELLKEAGAAEAGLYRYDVNAAGTGGSLSLVSAGLSGALGLVAASADGQVAYFISEAVLAGSDAVAGAPNLYVNDRGAVSFIATLSRQDPVMLAAQRNPSNINEEVEVSLAPAEGDEREPTVEARVTPDGSRLVFQSHGSLTGFANGGHGEVYEYVLGGGVTCLSCGPVEPAQGDAELSYDSATAPLHPPLNITPDGEWVFFESDEPLVPQADNGMWNVYQYHDGEVSLVSPASDEGNARFLGASESGRDVFFSTTAKLVSSDVDSAGDIYDARIGGGFPEPPSAAGCEDAECQGVDAPLAAPSEVASMSQMPGEDVSSVSHTTTKKSTKHKRANRGKHASVRRHDEASRGHHPMRHGKDHGRMR